jgi:hypothetical protein
MYEKLTTGLAGANGPVSTAVASNGFIFCAQIPTDINGDTWMATSGCRPHRC